MHYHLNVYFCEIDFIHFIVYIFSHFSQDYIDALKLLDSYYSTSDETDIPDKISDVLETFGLDYDCQGFQGVFDYALSAVRGTLAAVDSLINKECLVSCYSNKVPLICPVRFYSHYVTLNQNISFVANHHFVLIEFIDAVLDGGTQTFGN